MITNAFGLLPVLILDPTVVVVALSSSVKQINV